MKKLITIFYIALLSVLLNSCMTGRPNHIKPIKKFNVNKYMGKWYEIARFNHSFENGLQKVYAKYSLNKNGTVKVVNSGFNLRDRKRTFAYGVAKFVEKPTKGYLKVSFFRPFYGSYIIFYLDKDYKNAFISGPNLNYLWFLSRHKHVSKLEKRFFIKKVKKLGFDTNRIIWVKQ